ncbi:uncharacterized protein LOC113290366 [Papaver somniferum]|uniref:uncharacterized protein LOC113290366 n=1 Tax=Papaver somniferum TaxID=3469 RepID=UPI000E6F4DBD|nr:uncharacterized protein LOC113290366 [Papaver somniferum]
MSPFQALYGCTPPHLAFPSTAAISVGVVEEYLKQIDVVMDILKDALHYYQERRKLFADLKRTKRHFEVWDKVYLKLQPYIQAFVSLRRNLKLAVKYYGTFTVLYRIILEAYKLHLPAEERIHHVFRISQLKKQIGISHTPSPALPILDTDRQILVIPAAALDSRTITRNGIVVPQLLIQWTTASAEDATWEDSTHIQHHFAKFNP